MNLKNYLRNLDSPKRQEMAKDVGTTLGQLMNVAYGYRTCSTELAVAIEKYTEGAVSRKELCPDKWQARWPDLAQAA